MKKTAYLLFMNYNNVVQSRSTQQQSSIINFHREYM
jgi:hypothetical protein